PEFCAECRPSNESACPPEMADFPKPFRTAPSPAHKGRFSRQLLFPALARAPYRAASPLVRASTAPIPPLHSSTFLHHLAVVASPIQNPVPWLLPSPSQICLPA